MLLHTPGQGLWGRVTTLGHCGLQVVCTAQLFQELKGQQAGTRMVEGEQLGELLKGRANPTHSKGTQSGSIPALSKE